MAHRQTSRRQRRQRRRRSGPPRPQPARPTPGGGGGNGNGGPGWGKRIAGAIAMVAALVGIAGGVRALLPGDSDELVKLGPVVLTEGARLSEYEARTTEITSAAGAAERGTVVGFATLLAQAPDETTTAEPTATAEPTTTVEPTATAAPTATTTVEPTATAEPTTTADPTAGAQSLAPSQQLRLAPTEVDTIDSVVERIGAAAPQFDIGACGSPDELARCPMLPIVNAIVLPDGGAGAPAEAARRVVAILKSARHVASGRHKDVLGVVVHVDAVLTGFGDEDVRIAWSLYRVDGGRLPKSWLREVTVLRFRVDNDRAHRVSQPFWAPLPKARGRYKIVVTAYDEDGLGRGTVHTKAFG